MTKIMRAVLIMKADLEAAELSSYQHGAVGFPPGEPPEFRRRPVVAYRKPLAVHRARPVQVRPQRNQKASCRAKSQASQFRRGPVS
jgi:hypothetical protein